MQGTRYAMVALIGTLLLLSACKRENVAEKYHPATIEETDQEGIMRVTLDARAAERIGLETTPVAEERVGGTMRKVIPYGAIMYDTKGDTWTYTNPAPLVFIRHKVLVDDVQGDRVILKEGPPSGTVVVTVGAAMLMGAEHKYGH